jgi:hypothetical protein
MDPEAKSTKDRCVRVATTVIVTSEGNWNSCRRRHKQSLAPCFEAHTRLMSAGMTSRKDFSQYPLSISYREKRTTIQIQKDEHLHRRTRLNVERLN